MNDYNYKLVFTVNAYFTYNVECTAESTPTLRHIVKQKKTATNWIKWGIYLLF